MRKAIDILIDTSVSMNQPIQEGAEGMPRYNAVLTYIRDIIPKIYEPDLYYGLCTFGALTLGARGDGTQVHRLLDIEQHSHAKLMDKLEQMPEKLPYGANTPLADAILNSMDQLKECDVEHRSIFVFSDGEDTGSKKTTMEEVLAVANDATLYLGWNYFEIYAVGIGSLDSDLKSLSEKTNGIAIEVEVDEPDKIQKIFTEIALKHLPAHQRELRAAEISVRDLIVPAANRMDSGMRQLQGAMNALSAAVATPNQEIYADIKSNREEIDGLKTSVVALGQAIVEEEGRTGQHVQNAVDRLKISIDELGKSIAENEGRAERRAQDVLDNLKILIDWRSQSVTDPEELAKTRDRELQRKINNVGRASILLGSLNLVILIGLVALTAWTADGVFNMWNVITHLSTYLIENSGN